MLPEFREAGRCSDHECGCLWRRNERCHPAGDSAYPRGEQKVLSREELDLSYRHSCIPKNHFLVLEAELSLTPAPEQEIRAKMAELREKRVEKQPLEYPSAGSTFKRPEAILQEN